MTNAEAVFDQAGDDLERTQVQRLAGMGRKTAASAANGFPITAYVLAAVFDVISYCAAYNNTAAGGANSGIAQDFFAAGTYVIIAGAIVSLGAALTGFWDWWKGIERDRSTGFLGRAKHTQVWRTINWHMTVMLTVTAIVIIDIVVRLVQFDQGYAQLPTMILSVLAAALVAYGAGYGGSLVYEYQFNVESLEGSTAWDEAEAGQMPGEKGHPRYRLKT
jgi:uncharacterized membrane protein